MFELNKSRVNSIIKNLDKGKVLVIGDFAIDEMIYGQTHRISREAPILILKHSETNILLGAASNAAHNISSINSGKAAAIGIYGDDYYGPLLIESLRNKGVDSSYMVKDNSRVTTTKTRISGSSTQSVTQQIVRIDREENKPLSKDIESKIINNIDKIAPDFDAILLSDYGIGIMTPKVIDAATLAAKKNNLVLAVDSQTKLTRFNDITVITPNQPEAEATLGYEIKDEKTLEIAGNELLKRTNAQMILITRGSQGMTLFDQKGEIFNIPAFNKRDVFDVTGAGDTVISSFILALCAGATPQEAAIIGNLAASITVRRFGVATTNISEMSENLEKLTEESLKV